MSISEVGLDQGSIFAILKEGGLFVLVVYLIWSDRAERKDNREADLKRSEAATLMASVIGKLTDYLNRKDKAV